MILVIAGGRSVNDYIRKALKELAARAYTICVNDAFHYFPSDAIVALDGSWLAKNATELKQHGGPVISRDWWWIKEKLPEMLTIDDQWATESNLSGIAAAIIADKLAETMLDRVFVIGLDGKANGHFYDDPGKISTTKTIPEVKKQQDYAALGLSHITNLGKSSAISCWPKQDHLPKPVSRDYWLYRRVLPRLLADIGPK